MPPEPLHLIPSHDSAILCAVVVLFSLVAVNFRHVVRTAGADWNALRSFRDRQNVFDEPTAAERPIRLLLSVQFVVYAGIMIYCAAARSLHPAPAYSPLAVGAVVAVVGAYYLLQLGAYRLVGYTFASPENSRIWLGSFRASQSLLGLILVVPTLILLFYPRVWAVMLGIGALAYVAARFVFIVKGFRIFYLNFGSIFYFILYLCTLEILPAVYVWFAVVFITRTLG